MVTHYPGSNYNSHFLNVILIKALCFQGHTYLLIIALGLVCLLIVAMDLSLALTLKWMNDNLEFSYKQSGKLYYQIINAIKVLYLINFK